MTVEIALLISGVSLAFGIYQGITNMKRNNRHDDKNDATQLTTVIVKLENIGDGVNEIKADMKNVKSDVGELKEKQVRTEESLKSAWKRIEIIEGRKPGASNE